MSKLPEVIINADWCKSCGICVAFCPRNVLEMDTFTAKVVRPEQCIGCLICENLCPDFAITVVLPEKEREAVK